MRADPSSAADDASKWRSGEQEHSNIQITFPLIPPSSFSFLASSPHILWGWSWDVRKGSEERKQGCTNKKWEAPQGWRTSFLESHSLAEFCFNPNQTHLNKLINVWSVTRKLQADEFFSGLELNSAGLWCSRTGVCHPWYRTHTLPQLLSDYVYVCVFYI